MRGLEAMLAQGLCAVGCVESVEILVAKVSGRDPVRVSGWPLD